MLLVGQVGYCGSRRLLYSGEARFPPSGRIESRKSSGAHIVPEVELGEPSSRQWIMLRPRRNGGAMADVTERPGRPDLSALRIDERARRDPKRRTWRAIGAGLAALLVVSAVLWFAVREKAPEIEVATVRAGKGGRPTLLNASGYVTPRQRATIAAQITARVHEIHVDEGMHVEAGEGVAEAGEARARAPVVSSPAGAHAPPPPPGDPPR